jgi:hypothetical protein
MDVSETADSIDIAVELTGISEKDVEVQLVEDVLTIRGEKKGPERGQAAELSRGRALVRQLRPLGPPAPRGRPGPGAGVLRERGAAREAAQVGGAAAHAPDRGQGRRGRRRLVRAKQQQDHPAADGGGSTSGGVDPAVQAMSQASGRDGDGAERQPS